MKRLNTIVSSKFNYFRPKKRKINALERKIQRNRISNLFREVMLFTAFLDKEIRKLLYINGVKWKTTFINFAFFFLLPILNYKSKGARWC